MMMIDEGAFRFSGNDETIIVSEPATATLLTERERRAHSNEAAAFRREPKILT